MILSNTAVSKPVFTTMLMLALMVFGVIGYQRLGVDQFPQVDFPNVSVTTIQTGANPEVIEENITKVLEDEVNTIEGIRKVTSVSSHGASILNIEFELERDIDIAAQDVRDKVSGALKKLPEDIDPPVVRKENFLDHPIMWLALSGDLPIAEITDYAENTLKPRFQTITGVGSIQMGGRRQRAIRVWVDPAALKAYQLAASDVVTAIGRQNVDVPGGLIEGKDVEFSVKTQSEIESLDQLRNLVVTQRNGIPITLRQVARIEDGMEDFRSLARYSLKSSVGMGIKRQPGANTVAVAQAVKAELEKVKKTLPPQLRMDIAFDSSSFIEDSIAEVEHSLIYGAILAIVVVFFFLLSIRSTIIIGLAIPISLIGTFGFMYFMGFTLNNMTLLALTLSVGVVIDDAIVVLENIFRHREEGAPAMQAATEGTTEITFAAMAATFSIAAVFIPVAFMEGIIGRFFFQFGVAVAIAILLSLLVSLTLTPMLCSRFLVITKRHNLLYRAIDGFYTILEKVYRKNLQVALRHRWLVVALAFGVFVFSLQIGKYLGKEFVPSEDQSRFFSNFEAPVGSTMEYTNSRLEKLEKIYKNTPEIRSFFAAIGLGDATNVNSGIMFVRMIPPGERTRTQDEVIQYLRREVAKVPGVFTTIMSLSGGFGGQRGAPVELVLSGPDLEVLYDVIQKVMNEYRQIPGIVDVNTDLKVGNPEIDITIDREKAGQLGVDMASIAETVNALVAGINVSKYKSEGEQYDIRVQLEQSARSLPQDITRLDVRDRQGNLIPLANVVHLDTVVGPNVIRHYNLQRSATITANLEGGKTADEAINDLQRVVDKYLPQGYRTALSGQAESFRESMASMIFALILAIVIIYMVLASQFNSFIHPLTVMLALPLSVVGALGGLWLFGMTINMFSLIGIVLLVGLVTKNSILLVDYTNQLRERGMERTEAVLTASPVRLRPILMTALSMIFGVVPVAFGWGAGSETRAPMGVATMFGMLSSTILTLMVVPVAYTLFDDLVHLFSRKSEPESVKKEAEVLT